MNTLELRDTCALVSDLSVCIFSVTNENNEFVCNRDSTSEQLHHSIL